MKLDAAIRRARMDAECARREANGYRAHGMENCAALSERNAEMLEALVDAAEKWLAATVKNGREDLKRDARNG